MRVDPSWFPQAACRMGSLIPYQSLAGHNVLRQRKLSSRWEFSAERILPEIILYPGVAFVLPHDAVVLQVPGKVLHLPTLHRTIPLERRPRSFDVFHILARVLEPLDELFRVRLAVTVDHRLGDERLNVLILCIRTLYPLFFDGRWRHGTSSDR
uniref:(northern house mosquito) hypothetical protein n=1 Tax=Culex pipiens TaxID=7175 RepID=A0A8D8EWF2_CULPI